MVGYLQYKAFNTIEELNEWLKEFQAEVGGKVESFTRYRNGEMDILRGIQFLGSASVEGSDENVGGEAHFYPVAQYCVARFGARTNEREIMKLFGVDKEEKE